MIRAVCGSVALMILIRINARPAPPLIFVLELGLNEPKTNMACQREVKRCPFLCKRSWAMAEATSTPERRFPQ
jgi:hypothetical protein